MNVFNCFQAMAFYTMVPLLIQWLFKNDYTVWGYIAAVCEFVGFVLLSVTLAERTNQ